MPLNEFFPPPPKFTEANIRDQSGKVFIVTGGAVGVGLGVAKILYQKNAAVYIATRSLEKMKRAVTEAKEAFPLSHGRLETLLLDLSDLTKIKSAAQDFLSREERLDALFNNAGVMNTPTAATTAQGHELQMGTNCLGPCLFTRLLEPILIRTARSSEPGSVRAVYVSSMISFGTPRGGIRWDDSAGRPKVLGSPMDNYMGSKVGGVFLAHDAARRLGKDGVIAVSLHPGLMKTELQRNMNPVAGVVMGIVFKPARYGAYTELFAALSPDITMRENGSFILPWGRMGYIPDHIERGMKSEENGGSGLVDRFISYCEREISSYQ